MASEPDRRARVQNLMRQLGAQPAAAVNQRAVTDEDSFSEQLFRLDGRIAIVTGASVGIGFEVARTYSNLGAFVLITARTESKILAAAKKISAETGNPVIGVKSDVSMESQCKAVVEKCVREFGKLDILVNNAGIGPPVGLLEEYKQGEFEKVVAVNQMGPVYMCKHALPYLKKSKAGRIVNVGSLMSHVGGYSRFSAYTTTKHALTGLTKTLAREMRGSPVCVNQVDLGPVLTEMQIAYIESQGLEEAIKKHLGDVIVGRIADVREITGIFVYLAGDLSSFTTGTCVAVDGGWTT